MEADIASEGEEECGTLKLRSRNGETRNSPPHEAAAEAEAETGGEVESFVYLDRDEDTKSTGEITATKSSAGSLFIGEEKLGNNEMDFESKSCENQNAGNYSSPKHATRHAKGQCENGSAESDPAMDMSGAVVNGGLVNWNKTVVEMDVEKVLEEQDTHDLYCPNCNSCITKRVILRKRKQTLQDPQVDSKSEKTQLLLQPHMEASPDTTVANDPSHDTEPDVFRCLSCFNFFIPTATGFKLFPTFGRNNEGETLQSSLQAPVKNLNCISSILELLRGKITGNEPGNDTIHSDKEEIEQPLIQSQHLDESEALLNQTARTASMKGFHLPGRLSRVGDRIDDATKNSLPDKQSSLVLLMPGSSLHQEAQIGNGDKLVKEVEQNNSGKSTAQDTEGEKVPENIHVDDGKQVREDIEHIPPKDEVNALILSTPEGLLIGDGQLGTGGNFMCEPKEYVAGVDAGNNGAQIESNKVNSTYPGRTFSDENSNASLIPSAQLHRNLNINSTSEVKDPENKRLEDDKNIVILTIPEAFQHADAQVESGENLVEAPKRAVSGSETMQSDEKNGLSLLLPLPHPEEIWPDERNGAISADQNGHLLEKTRVAGGKLMDDPEAKPLEDENINLILSKPEALVSGERKYYSGEILEEATNNNLAGTVKPEMLVSSQSKENVPAMATPGLLLETHIDIGKQRVDGAIAREWDILKSIVYGGLIESILSLGLVSSAAGADATTLKIVGLGVANLISGLFVIVHNLRELKNDPHSSMDQGGKLDRYQATLGRRESFWLHATVAVLSYILFGLLPPVIYGFSFRKSDNKEYKLIAVAAASLLCITLLAVGKAHVQEASKRYVKTVLYYVGIGLMASGLSYVAGELLKNLLDKLGWFDSSTAAPVSSNLGFLEMKAMKSGWASH
ncbi:hypothetical protein MRB53_026873 [Persea americana]|uniref:Uncharacterized protein n=1 Tax=Persea americana TaxID=3435 RepID=A0ACC2LJ91_PERAE|nr:hypothetical protein MRB53_026873 [Persea americana]